MNIKALSTAIYASFVLFGGIIGYLRANSYPSLVMGSLFSILLFFCSYAIYKKSVLGHILTLILSSFLLVFFAFRYFQKLSFMPAGLMVTLSLLLISIFLIKKQDKAFELSE